jgi:hypothetical protein
MLQKMFYGMNTGKLLNFAEANYLKQPLIKKKMAGIELLILFAKSRNLSLWTPKARSMSHVAGFTRPKVIRFFEIQKTAAKNIKLHKNGNSV